MDASTRMTKILDHLREEFGPWSYRETNSFEVLVATVLSQNTSSRNSRKAFHDLISKFPSPVKLAKADLREIQRVIKPAGLYTSKSRDIKKLAKIVSEKYGGDLGKVLGKPPEEARNELLELPRVGPKTADCLLLFAAGRDVLPVDTHVARVAKRLGFAGWRDDRETVKQRIEPLIPKGRRGEAHIFLIQHGRKYCRARGPRCGECPISDLCPSNVNHFPRASHISASRARDSTGQPPLSPSPRLKHNQGKRSSS